jgi:hypothetical protein
MMAGKLAESGWVVEVILAETGHESDSRFFAVGTDQAIEAERDTLRYPGIFPADKRIARRRLSSKELLALGLNAGAVRPYGCDRSGEQE